MKKLILILFGLFVVISCSTSDDNSNNSEIKVNFDKETLIKSVRYGKHKIYKITPILLSILVQLDRISTML